MRNSIHLFLILLLAVACTGKTENQTSASEDHSQHQPAQSENKPSKSPRTSAMAMVDGNHIHFDYSSPSVRERQIFGGLVAFGEVWVTNQVDQGLANVAAQFESQVVLGCVVTPGYVAFGIKGDYTVWQGLRGSAK